MSDYGKIWFEKMGCLIASYYNKLSNAIEVRQAKIWIIAQKAGTFKLMQMKEREEKKREDDMQKRGIRRSPTDTRIPIEP